MKQHNFRRILPLALVCTAVSGFTFTGFESGRKAGPVTGCRSACLIDADSGECVYSLNEHARMPIASVCKVMTLTLCLDAVEDGAVVLAEDVLPLIGGAQHFAALFEQRPAAAYVVVVAVREQGVPRSQPPLAALLQNAGLGGVDDDAGAFVGGEDVAVCGKADGIDLIDFHDAILNIWTNCATRASIDFYC